MREKTISISFGYVFHEFNFSKFHRQPHDKELPIKYEIIGLASIVLPPTDPLEQYLLDHENDIHMNQINEIFFNQTAILKHNLTVETLGDPLPPKGDPPLCLNYRNFLIHLNMCILMKR